MSYVVIKYLVVIFNPLLQSYALDGTFTNYIELNRPFILRYKLPPTILLPSRTLQCTNAFILPPTFHEDTFMKRQFLRFQLPSTILLPSMALQCSNAFILPPTVHEDTIYYEETILKS